jgi:hypothetical protein
MEDGQHMVGDSGGGGGSGGAIHVYKEFSKSFVTITRTRDIRMGSGVQCP